MHAFQLLIVHSQPLVVAGIETLIQRVDGWQVIGTTANASSALQFVQHTTPHAVVVEQQLPGINGITLCSMLHQYAPNIATALIGNLTPNQRALANAHGVSYVIPPNINTRDMAILAHRLRQHVNELRQSRPAHDDREAYFAILNKRAQQKRQRPNILSKRELDVVGCLAHGASTKQIATMLTMSPHTVKHHLDNIMSKCDVHRRSDIVTLAIKMGWVDAEQFEHTSFE
ncbi:MAG: DNA-binding response regulator [Chloroflexia bacterium]|nr:DNA-binding response regulator [Chloroflexia bacterium]